MKAAYSVRIAFFLLSLLGLALLPRLSFRLFPGQALPSLSISFTWPGASPQLVEQEVSSRLEGVLATLPGLQEMRSTSSPGRGEIRLGFDRDQDMDLRGFEVAALIRQTAPQLPEGVSYPLLQRDRPEASEAQTLLTYTLNGQVAPALLQQYAEAQLRPALSLLEGLDRVEIYGASPMAWTLTYDLDQLRALNLTPAMLRQALQSAFRDEPLGYGWIRSGDNGRRQRFLRLQGNPPQQPAWERIPVSLRGGRIVYLSDLVRISYEPRSPDRYYRLNGLNTVNLVLYAQSTANQLEVAAATRASIERLRTQLPTGYSLVKLYDSTGFLQEELNRLAVRSIFSALILLAFVWLATRSLRYLSIILLSLLANLGIACFCYYLLGLDIHLYSLAGITVSLGLIIDNSIVMIEHLRLTGNRRVFLALLAATLTTLAALGVILFLPPEQRMILQDFAQVIIINLAVSLGVALWLIPSLFQAVLDHQHTPMQAVNASPAIAGPLKAIRLYLSGVTYCIRYRFAFLLLALLAFGLPIFLLPDRLDNRQAGYDYDPAASEAPLPWYDRWYNATLGSNRYQIGIRPWLDKALGGSLRLFVQETYPRSGYSPPERTALHIRARMPYGSTLEQMNQTFIYLENYLAQFEEVAQFETQINSSQAARMVIYFKRAYERSIFPFYLKGRLESLAVDLGGADWWVYGVGQGFSNATGLGSKNSRIVLRGYNYDALLRYANRLKARLLEHPRIKEVAFNARLSWDHRPNYEFELHPDTRRLAELGAGPEMLLNELRPLSRSETPVLNLYDENGVAPVILRARQAGSYDRWRWENQLLVADSSRLRPGDVASLRKLPASDIIYKEDQQYQVLVEYDFIGPFELMRRVKGQMIEETRRWLPLGYTGGPYSYGGFGADDRGRYGLLILVLLLIYGICAVLLESLSQPLAVIGMVPLSFIGLFLTFYLFDIRFDQGGYAALLVLSGLSVNAALYIINDYNNLRQQEPGIPRYALYVQAVRQKILPITLSVVSTILGLLPFLWQGRGDAFWFALAAGTIGGLLLSLPALLLFLPLLLLKREKALEG